MRFRPILFAAALALGACDGGTQGAGVTAEEPDGAAPGVVDPAQDGPAAGEDGAATAGGQQASVIPAALQGRWGLTSADCEPGRADAKGLLTISNRTLEFYESVGTLDAVEEAGPSRVRASFDFTGEGMTWERDMVLEAAEDGTLVRRDFGDEAAPDPFRYTRCS